MASAILDSRFGQSPLDQFNPWSVLLGDGYVSDDRDDSAGYNILYCTGWWFGTCFFFHSVGNGRPN